MGPLIGLAYDTPNIGPCGSFLLQHHPPVAFVIILGHVVHSTIPFTISSFYNILFSIFNKSANR